MTDVAVLHSLLHPRWVEKGVRRRGTGSNVIKFTQYETAPRIMWIHVGTPHEDLETVWGYRRDPAVWLQEFLNEINEFINLP